jgi:aspartyl-tRNA(Asn)/glutamyl-tRNA(Gln) amidotransferase subunit C
MITKEQVEHIAKLARIEITPEQQERFQKEFSQIVEYFEKLALVDTSGVLPMIHSVELENVAREDRESKISQELAQKLVDQAPNTKNEFVKVKQILA